MTDPVFIYHFHPQNPLLKRVLEMTDGCDRSISSVICHVFFIPIGLENSSYIFEKQFIYL